MHIDPVNSPNRCCLRPQRSHSPRLFGHKHN